MSTEATKMTNQEQEMVHLTINNIPLAVPKGTKIMQAAQKLGIDIPHLCYHEDQRIKARCRLCSIEVVGKRRLLAACSTEVWEGMEVHTDTQIVRDTQVAILQLMLANHHKDCLSCPRNQNCDLQRLCSRFNIQHSSLPSDSIVRSPAASASFNSYAATSDSEYTPGHSHARSRWRNQPLPTAISITFSPSRRRRAMS